MRAVEQRRTGDFYVVGGTMRPDAPSYVERTADRELVSALLSNEFCHVLTARQMGKSSLMLRTAAALRRSGVVTAVLDLTALGQNLTPEQWYGGLIVQLGDRLRLEDELLSYWRSQAVTGPMQRWLGTIRRIGLQRDRKRLVIFVDEIDAVRSLNFSTDEFFAGIRECYNLRNEDPEIRRLTFCLLGVASPADLIRDTRTTPFNIGKRIELSDFTEREALALAEGLRREMSESRAILKRILTWTNGHPYLTQRMCRSVAEDEGVRGSRDIDQVVEHLFFSKRARENDDNLIFVRERLLRSGTDVTALLNLYSKIVRGKAVADDDSNPLVSILSLSGITRAEHGALRVRNRIYERVFNTTWINSNLPNAEVRRQREAFKRGVWRSAAISTIILGVIAALALMAYWQSKRAIEQALVNQRLLYLAQMKLAHQELENANIAHVEEIVRATEPRPGEEDLRGFEWYLFNRYAHSEVFRLAEPDRIAALKFTPASLVAIAGASHSMFQQNREYSIKLYNHTTNAVISSFSTPAGNNFDIVVFSPDLSYVATDAPDYSVVLWDLNSGERIRAFTGHRTGITAVAFARGNQYLASASIDGEFKIWDRSTGLELLSGNAARENPRLAFSPDGEFLAVTVGTQTVRLLSARTGKTVRSFTTEGLLFGFASADGRSLNARPISSTVGMLFFSPDGTTLIATTMSGQLFSWVVRTGMILPWLQSHSNEILSWAFSPDGERLATGSFDRTVKLWDWKNQNQQRTIRGHGNWVGAADWSPDGRLLITGDSNGMIKIWDLSTRELPVLPTEGAASFLATGLSSTNELVALGITNSSGVKLWSLSSGRELADFRVDGKMIHCAVFSRDLSMVALGVNADVKVYEAKTGSLVMTMIGREAPVYSLDFSPDGKTILSGDKDGNLILWELSTGRAVAKLDSGNSYYRARFSPDGKRIGSADQDGAIRLWDINSLAIVKTLVGHTSNAKVIAFSPDGRLMATAADDNTVRLWDVTSGTELKRLVQSDSIQRFAFTPDGTRLVTGGLDGTIKLWDVTSMQEVVTLGSLDSEVTSATFSPNGTTLVVSSANGTVKVWQADHN